MKYWIPLLTMLFLSSCHANIHYLGDTQQATDKVDVFYSKEDIEKPFKIIGQLKGMPESSWTKMETVKTSMIKKAKEKGANGIVFLLAEPGNPNIYPILGDLIVYKE